MVQSWSAGLPPDVRKRFLSRRLSDFTADPLTCDVVARVMKDAILHVA
jgi:hypothetical protein